MDLIVQDVHEFVGAINAVRLNGGLDPLDEIEFDACEPNSGTNCLSAHNAFMPLGARVNPYTAQALAGRGLTPEVLAEICGTRVIRGSEVMIPEAILTVTSVFDSAGECSDEGTVLRPLRALFVEAGYVDVD